MCPGSSPAPVFGLPDVPCAQQVASIHVWPAAGSAEANGIDTSRPPGSSKRCGRAGRTQSITHETGLSWFACAETPVSWAM